ncbi:MAG: manganese efflux pump MntP family protein [Mogibacterium sp.]|nr:manganese efflux pump MntP family protein [Mogibacterium sp.]
MDAFSVSLANGLADKNMKTGRMLTIAGTFAGFQFAMPMIGWVFVHTAESKLEWFSGLVPWIALLLLLYIGGKMLKEGIEENREPNGGEQEQVGAGDLIMQGIATSIDALSVGFTIAAYSLLQAVSASFIIGAVTLIICMAGLRIGQKLGTVLAGKASILGGIILIGIGLEIWIRGVFF